MNSIEKVTEENYKRFLLEEKDIGTYIVIYNGQIYGTFKNYDLALSCYEFNCP